jgi:hypothetical protein
VGRFELHIGKRLAAPVFEDEGEPVGAFDAAGEGMFGNEFDELLIQVTELFQAEAAKVGADAIEGGDEQICLDPDALSIFGGSRAQPARRSCRLGRFSSAPVWPSV